jgi:hypothetical protein
MALPMNKEELEALLRTLDLWVIGFGILVAIGVTGEAVVGFMHFRKSSELQRLQAAENLAQQHEIERLRKESEAIRSDTAKALERVANAEQQAAESNRIAEQERLARLQIEERLAPRHVSSDQAKTLKQELLNLVGHKITVTTAALQPEIVEYAQQIARALRAAGLDASFQGALLPISQAGLLLVSGPDRLQEADAIGGAFIKAGMVTGKISLRSVPNVGDLEVVVGPKE